VVQARDALMEARHADMARELRGTLTTGEACPVCDQPVHVVPRAPRAATVAAAERALAKAVRQEERSEAEQQKCAAAEVAARAASASASEGVTRGEVAATKADAALREAEANVASTRSQLTDWLGEEGDARASFQVRESELTAAERSLNGCNTATEAARIARDSAKDAAAEAAVALVRIGGRLANAWGKLGDDRDVAADADSIRAAFLALGEEIIVRHEIAASAGADATGRTEAALSELGGLLRDVDLNPQDDFGRALTSAGIAHGTAAEAVRGLEERIARAGSLEARLLTAEGSRDLAARLAEDLKPSRFLAFLLEEERAQLADLGSEHFEQLTDGNYRFTQDDRFDILDVNAAGAVRKADSLSGGETFLASLALALGLAEMVARSGGRLDAFFLDEGFGSLDPEHLDRAMDGIGRLVAGDAGRLVVVVSHVAEMREAVEDLIVLDKHPVTGDTVVISGARPA
jgi:exonuclease SbcC